MCISAFVSHRLDSKEKDDFRLTTYPKISIITPSYGQETFIERTILSVLNQNYPNLEFIVVDDASKDGSNKIINKYRDHLILAGDGINRGQTAAINYGLKMATGDIIAFQNADDLFAPNAFRAVAKAFNKYPDSELFFGNLYIINENDTIVNAMRMTPYSYDEHLYIGMQMHNQSMFFKPDLLAKYGYLNEAFNYSFDYEIILRFTENSQAIPKYLEDLWGAFRIHSASKTTNITPTYKQERVVIGQYYKGKQDKAKNAAFIKFKSYFRKTCYFLKRGQINYILSKINKLIL